MQFVLFNISHRPINKALAKKNFTLKHLFERHRAFDDLPNFPINLLLFVSCYQKALLSVITSPLSTKFLSEIKIQMCYITKPTYISFILYASKNYVDPYSFKEGGGLVRTIYSWFADPGSNNLVHWIYIFGT